MYPRNCGWITDHTELGMHNQHVQAYIVCYAHRINITIPILIRTIYYISKNMVYGYDLYVIMMEMDDCVCVSVCV